MAQEGTCLSNPPEPDPATHDSLNNQPPKGHQQGCRSGGMAPGTQWHIYYTKLGLTSVITPSGFCRWAACREPMRAARSLAWAGRYMTSSSSNRGQWPKGLLGQQVTTPAQGMPWSTHSPATKRRQATEAPPSGLSPHIITPSGISGFSVFHLVFLCVQVLQAEGL